MSRLTDHSRHSSSHRLNEQSRHGSARDLSVNPLTHITHGTSMNRLEGKRGSGLAQILKAKSEKSGNGLGGKGLQRSQNSNPDTSHYPRLLQAVSNLALDPSRAGTATTSLGIPVQPLPTFTGFLLSDGLALEQDPLLGTAEQTPPTVTQQVKSR
ncbi:hypothetical protein WISP_12927 [Willisornis vidua]|uniref:Uncharacterized protein n=1 Tax=Willisornis vidua TaxID=1566151 RepID=A0ABQ9DV47_9PASS|nr:hypothetical protein WISP_12927 [Willisornis vidua]